MFCNTHTHTHTHTTRTLKTRNETITEQMKKYEAEQKDISDMKVERESV